MAVQKDRPAWTDDRLDDLARTTRDGMIKLNASVVELSRRVDAQGESLTSRIDALQRTLILGTIGMLGTIVAGFAAAILTLS